MVLTKLTPVLVLQFFPTTQLNLLNFFTTLIQRMTQNKTVEIVLDLPIRFKQRQKIENGLRSSLENDQFTLAFMPIFDCDNDDIVAVEALLRCRAPELEGIGPDQFIPVAESTGLIKEIDLWVVDHALQSLVVLHQQHNFTGKMCINISGVELNNENFTLKTFT